MAYQLGIDVGTSFTCIALARDGRVDVCQLGHSSQLVPSIVSIRDEGVVLTGFLLRDVVAHVSSLHPHRGTRAGKPYNRQF